jgi:hypothetical protein
MLIFKLGATQPVRQHLAALTRLELTWWGNFTKPNIIRNETLDCATRRDI